MNKYAIALLSMLLTAGAAQAEDLQQARQDVEHDKQVVAADQQTLNEDDNAIRDLDRQRNEALRVKNYPLASKLQTAIDAKRAERHKTEEELKQAQDRLDHQKHEEKEDCEHNPTCEANMKRRELTSQLDAAHSKLAADESAAARIPEDKATIAKIESELSKYR